MSTYKQLASAADSATKYTADHDRNGKEYSSVATHEDAYGKHQKAFNAAKTKSDKDHHQMYMDRHIKYLSDADKSKHKLRESNISFKEFLAENVDHEKISQYLKDYSIPHTMGTYTGTQGKKTMVTIHKPDESHSEKHTKLSAARKLLDGGNGMNAIVEPERKPSHGFHGQTSSIARQSNETTEKDPQASKVTEGVFDSVMKAAKDRVNKRTGKSDDGRVDLDKDEHEHTPEVTTHKEDNPADAAEKSARMNAGIGSRLPTKHMGNVSVYHVDDEEKSSKPTLSQHLSTLPKTASSSDRREAAAKYREMYGESFIEVEFSYEKEDNLFVFEVEDITGLSATKAGMYAQVEKIVKSIIEKLSTEESTLTSVVEIAKRVAKQ